VALGAACAVTRLLSDTTVDEPSSPFPPAPKDGETALERVEAELIDGRAIARDLRAEVKVGSAEVLASSGHAPGLAVVLVGARPDSQTYVRMKKKAAAEVGFHSVDVALPASATERDIMEAVHRLNGDPLVHGILVQLPLPAHVDEAAVLREIAVDKDVDGFSALNVGRLCLRGGQAPSAVACTPAGCVELLRRSGVQVSGKTAVVVGRSNIVGMPVAALLQQLDATVTVMHSRTPNPADVLKTADIVVAAVGRPGFVRGAWLKPGCVVIDVGINAVDDPTAKRGRRLVGDVAFDEAKRVASKITPVPGGVGPMTIAMLLKNTLSLAQAAAAKASSTPKLTRVSSGLELSRDDEWGKAAVQVDDSGAVMTGGLVPLSPVPKDIEVSQACTPLPIPYVGRQAGLEPRELIPWGPHKAKVDAAAVGKRCAGRGDGSLVVVCGINPTPLGEGKSTTTIGLCQALGAHLDKKVITTIRQPSQGPTFGIKGGAAGGGYSQVVPMEEFNLHMTGDIHAIVAANNLVAAALDARVFHESTQKDAALFDRLVPPNKDKASPVKRPLAPSQRARLERLGVTGPALEDAELLSEADRVRFARLDVDPGTITWKRVLDTCDRFLRGVEVGRAPTEKGRTRETGFDIAVASEIMAVLALAADMDDLRKRLGRMVVGRSRADGPHAGAFVSVDDLGVGGAVTVLMRDALMPTLMQTVEGTPVLVHAGPFANIAHGNSSVVADKAALKLVGPDGFVVTEAGFGADIGGEKCFDIKCRAGGLTPRCAVVVATLRALKLHGGAPPVVAGRPLPAEYSGEAPELLAEGVKNLQHHVRCLAEKFGLSVVVAVNKFANDSAGELDFVAARAREAGAAAAVTADHWARGGAGARDLGEAVVAACEGARAAPATFRPLYDLDAPVKDKVFRVCSEIYKAGTVSYSPLAEEQLKAYEALGLGGLPVCIAKTQYSLSTDAKLKGVPEGHDVHVREIRAAVGAGFLYLVCGDIMTVPGLPTRPGFVDVDLDTKTGRVIGLF